MADVNPLDTLNAGQYVALLQTMASTQSREFACWLTGEDPKAGGVSRKAAQTRLHIEEGAPRRAVATALGGAPSTANRKADTLRKRSRALTKTAKSFDEHELKRWGVPSARMDATQAWAGVKDIFVWGYRPIPAAMAGKVWMDWTDFRVRLGPRVLRVWAALSGVRDRGGHAHPSALGMAKNLGMTVGQVRHAIRTLRQLRLIRYVGKKFHRNAHLIRDDDPESHEYYETWIVYGDLVDPIFEDGQDPKGIWLPGRVASKIQRRVSWGGPRPGKNRAVESANLHYPRGVHSIAHRWDTSVLFGWDPWAVSGYFYSEKFKSQPETWEPNPSGSGALPGWRSLALAPARKGWIDRSSTFVRLAPEYPPPDFDLDRCPPNYPHRIFPENPWRWKRLPRVGRAADRPGGYPNWWASYRMNETPAYWSNQQTSYVPPPLRVGSPRQPKGTAMNPTAKKWAQAFQTGIGEEFPPPKKYGWADDPVEAEQARERIRTIFWPARDRELARRRSETSGMTEARRRFRLGGTIGEPIYATTWNERDQRWESTYLGSRIGSAGHRGRDGSGWIIDKYMPPYPSEDWVGSAIKPSPPTFKKGAHRRKRAGWLVEVYKNCVAAAYGKKPPHFSGRAGRRAFQRSKWVKTIMAAADKMVELDINPVKWVMWRVSYWHDHLGGTDCWPTFQWVFDPDKMEEHLGWYRRMSTSMAMPTKIMTPSAKEACRKRTYVKQIAMMGASMDYPGGLATLVADLLETYFPWGEYVRLQRESVIEAERMTKQMEWAAWRGEWVWEPMDGFPMDSAFVRKKQLEELKQQQIEAGVIDENDNVIKENVQLTESQRRQLGKHDPYPCMNGTRPGGDS